jgi:ABC-type multidrug transport system ATPase subunit
VLITDHNVRETLGLIDRAYIIHSGTVLTEGEPDEIVAERRGAPRLSRRALHALSGTAPATEPASGRCTASVMQARSRTNCGRSTVAPWRSHRS